MIISIAVMKVPVERPRGFCEEKKSVTIQWKKRDIDKNCIKVDMFSLPFQTNGEDGWETWLSKEW